MKPFRNLLLMASFLTLLSGLLGCGPRQAAFRSVGVADFARTIADADIVRLDVRTPDEYAAGHIAGAVNIDVLSPDFADKAAQLLPQGKTVALYCRSGRRSKKAAEILAARKYTVVELDSGYLGWTAAGQEVVK